MLELLHQQEHSARGIPGMGTSSSVGGVGVGVGPNSGGSADPALAALNLLGVHGGSGNVSGGSGSAKAHSSSGAQEWDGGEHSFNRKIMMLRAAAAAQQQQQGHPLGSQPQWHSQHAAMPTAFAVPHNLLESDDEDDMSATPGHLPAWGGYNAHSSVPAPAPARPSAAQASLPVMSGLGGGLDEGTHASLASLLSHIQGQPELLDEPLTKLLAQMASMDATANSLAPNSLAAHMSLIGTGGSGTGSERLPTRAPFQHGTPYPSSAGAGGSGDTPHGADLLQKMLLLQEAGGASPDVTLVAQLLSSHASNPLPPGSGGGGHVHGHHGHLGHHSNHGQHAHAHHHDTGGWGAALGAMAAQQAQQQQAQQQQQQPQATGVGGGGGVGQGSVPGQLPPSAGRPAQHSQHVAHAQQMGGGQATAATASMLSAYAQAMEMQGMVDGSGSGSAAQPTNAHGMHTAGATQPGSAHGYPYAPPPPRGSPPPSGYATGYPGVPPPPLPPLPPPAHQPQARYWPAQTMPPGGGVYPPSRSPLSAHTHAGAGVDYGGADGVPLGYADPRAGVPGMMRAPPPPPPPPGHPGAGGHHAHHAAYGMPLGAGGAMYGVQHHHSAMHAGYHGHHQAEPVVQHHHTTHASYTGPPQYDAYGGRVRNPGHYHGPQGQPPSLRSRALYGPGGMLLRPGGGPKEPGGTTAAAPQFSCDICNIQCNSEVNLKQHMASRKHLARLSRHVLAEQEAAALRDDGGGSGGGGSGSGGDGGVSGVKGEGAQAVVHSLCRQMITSELNTLVSELLLQIKVFQDQAWATNVVKAAAHHWYVCGLREVCKSVKLARARSVIIAPNIEQMYTVGGLDDHLQDILTMCGEQGVPVVFALTRKRLGQIYGCRKRVSAVALLDFEGIEELHGHMAGMAADGRGEWKRLRDATGEAPQVLLEEVDDDDEGDDGSPLDDVGGGDDVEDSDDATACMHEMLHAGDEGGAPAAGAAEGGAAPLDAPDCAQ
ncbi:hypothetical protein FOA52_010281 [Chlamydomonas sp. UWO 241]|nr:hypothetical protein FOA52_010281 [Chlamydomonas sp. UWO 241]